MGARGGEVAPNEVHKQVRRKARRKEDTQRGERDSGKQAMRSQVQAAKRWGLPCPPSALSEQGQELVAASATTQCRESRDTTVT